jgi:hypothetical protein
VGWLFFAVASAQEEACSPVAPAVLEGHLTEAEQALGSGSDARAPAAAAHHDARCLATPVLPATLGRLAWIEAELAAADLDEGRTWEWLRLARSVGAGTPPARIPAGAPVHEVLAAGASEPGHGGPTGMVLAVPPKGAMYADGVPITEPRLLLSTPHLVQVFERDLRVSGDWQMGGSFPSYLLTNPDAETVRSVRDKGRSDLPPDSWRPRKEGTEAAYREWLEKHPDGPFREDAEDALDDLAWAAAGSAATELAARQYLHDHPTGLHVADARFAIEDLAYRKVMAAPSRAAWEKLLADAPDGMYASEAKAQLHDLDWKAARTTDSAAAYHQYLEQWPAGRNVDRARQLEEERAFDLARRRGDDALRDFLSDWPESRWRDEAGAILGDVKLTDVTLWLDPSTLPAVAAALTRLLSEELTKRGFRVVPAPGEGSAVLRVTPGTEQKRGMFLVYAAVVLELGGLERPLVEQRVEAPMLPTDDPGVVLGKAVAANLLPMDRWCATPKPAP